MFHFSKYTLIIENSYKTQVKNVDVSDCVNQHRIYAQRTLVGTLLISKLQSLSPIRFFL